jgi:hypothetical protein
VIDLIIFPMPDERLGNVIHGIAAAQENSVQAAEA